MANCMLSKLLLVLINLLLTLSVNSQKTLSAVDSNGMTYNGIGVVSPGDTMTFKCPFDDSNWSRSSFTSGSSTEKLISQINIQIEKSTLILSNINFKDSAIYQCENKAESYKFSLNVIRITNVTNGIVPITTNNNEVNGLNFLQSRINEKGSANLSCSCECGNDTQVTIDWSGGAYQKMSKLYNIVSSTHETGVTSTLILNKAENNKSMYGQYKCACSAVSSAKKEKSVYLEVPPMFEGQSISIRATEGDSVVLNCSSWAYPQLNRALWWSYQNQPSLRAGIKVMANESGAGFSQLIIPNITSDDRGVYTCHATNTIGNNSVSYMLRVKGRYAALWPFIGIMIQLVILIGIIVVYEWNKSQKPKEDPSKDNIESRNELGPMGSDRGTEPDSVRQRLVKA